MLLTLDLATRIGYTLGQVTDPLFRVGHYVLPSTGPLIGNFADAYHRWLSSVLSCNRIECVVFESPVLMKNTRIETLRKLYGLAWHTEWYCRNKNIDVHEANVSQVKKFLTGNGRADKPMMMAAAKQMGFNPKVHDEADAIAIRLMFMSIHYPEALRLLRLDMGPLGVNVAKGGIDP